jgi:integrase/recombinase XerD
MTTTTALAVPAAAHLARAQGGRLPTYVDQDQARAVIDAAETTPHRLFLKALWQSGGRVSEVLGLRPCDVDKTDGAFVLTNLKQRQRALGQKKVYVSRELCLELLAFAKAARIATTAHFFTSRQSGTKPMSRAQAWRVVTACARRAGVLVVTRDGKLRPISGLEFRHSAALDMLRHGVPLNEVSTQLGHARLDTTLVYTRLANTERRSVADRRFENQASW